MKKFYSFCFLIISVKSLFSQESPTEKEYKWGVGIQINTIDKFSQYENSFEGFNTNTSQGKWTNKSFSLGLIGSYNLNENAFLRFRTGITNISIAYHRDDRDEYYDGIPNGAYRIIDEAITQKRFYCIPGVLWRFKANKLFDMHGGFELPFSIYKGYNSNGSETDYDTASVIVLKGDYTTTAPGGFSIGIGGVVGFNFHLHKRISIGADFSAALLFLKLGGDVVQTYSSTIPVSSTSTYHYLFNVNGFNYSGEKLSLNVVYSF